MSDDLKVDVLARLTRLEMFAGHVADWAGNPLLHIKARALLEADAQDAPAPAQTDMGNPITDDLAKRMKALVRKVASVPEWVLRNSSDEARADCAEARTIVALFPEPVDADLAFAREIIADAVSYGEQSVRQPEAKTSRDFRNGECDAGDLIARVVKQLRTRALERDSREG